MDKVLKIEMLERMNARFVILAVGRYALPVRFRIRGERVDCLVPTWTGMGDLLEAGAEATLVACLSPEDCLRWLFVRGPVALVPEPDWDELSPQPNDRLALADLYQILRIDPKRIELVDEQRGWGCRETADR